MKIGLFRLQHPKKKLDTDIIKLYQGNRGDKDFDDGEPIYVVKCNIGLKKHYSNKQLTK